MDQSEESPQQQYIADSASQMANTPPPLDDTLATSSNVFVPVSSTMRPPPPVSTTQHQLGYQDAQAQHLEHVRERLRLFWANQMQEIKPEDLKKNSLPLSRIKKIMKADEDVRMIGKETAAVFAKACEMFVLDMTSQAWINTEEDGRRTVQNKDIAATIYKTDTFDFLEQVIPRDELRDQILKATSTEPRIPGYNVPQQHGVGASSVINAGGQQLPPFMPWPQAHQQLDQQNPERLPISCPQAEQTPYQHNPEKPSPYAEQQPDQQNYLQQKES